MSEDEEYEELQGKLRKALGEIVWLHQVTEDLQQTNDELTFRVTQMKEDHGALMSENEHLSTRLAKSMSDLEATRLSDTSLEIQEEARREMEQLREEHYKLEAVHQSKLKEWEKQMREVHAKANSVESLEEELMRLRDENDVLRQSAEKAAQHERTISVCKRKLEQLEDIKSTMRQLEEDNNKAIKKNFKLEEELKLSNIWKKDLADVTKELALKQQKLLQESQRVIKAELDAKQYREKFENAAIETEKLQEENIRLHQVLQEEETQRENEKETTNLSTSSINYPQSVDLLSEANLNVITHNNSSSVTEESFESLPPATRQKLRRLEMENEKLRENLDSSINTNATNDGAKVLVEQLRRQEEILAENFLEKEQEILEMKKFYEDKIHLLKAQNVSTEDKLKRVELEIKILAQNNISKIKNMRHPEPDPLASVDAILDDGAISKEDLQNIRVVHQMEETLLASAFYSYGKMVHRSTGEMRNKTLLHRHRMSAINRAYQYQSHPSRISQSSRASGIF